MVEYAYVCVCVVSVVVNATKKAEKTTDNMLPMSLGRIIIMRIFL